MGWSLGRVGSVIQQAPNEVWVHLLPIQAACVVVVAAMFLGVFRETGMLKEIALSLVAVMPESVGQYLHVIVGALGVPLDLLTSTDAYYFSVLPII